MERFGISGFTFCRNAVSLGYPFVESISSILPIVDEFVVNVGKSTDSTLNEIQKINNPKIKIVESVWDKTQNKDARVLQQQAHIALSHCKYPWAFHLQVDEVVHEEDLPLLITLMKQNLTKKNVLGLMFRFLHFYLDFFTVNPWAFRREVRVIRNNGELRSAGDSCGFARKSDGLYLSKKLLGKEVLWTGARIFHYSSVMEPDALFKKACAMVGIRKGDLSKESQETQAHVIIKKLEEKYEIMKEYKGTHPHVMDSRIRNPQRFKLRKNRWLNWRFYNHVFTYGFKG
jgi:hypothetical protein